MSGTKIGCTPKAGECAKRGAHEVAVLQLLDTMSTGGEDAIAEMPAPFVTRSEQ